MKKISILTLCLLALFSCEKEALDQVQEEQQIQDQNTEIVLKERDPRYPLILSKKRTKNLKSKLKSGNEPFRNYLGRSLKTVDLPLTDYKNFGWNVIDVEKYLKDYPDAYYNVQIGSTSSYGFGYTNFDRYVEKSNITKKVKGGFKLNLGVVSIGAKRSMERTFSSTTINENNRVFGELHYQYMDSRYWLKNTSNDMKRIKSYVSKSFTDDLYNITPRELFDTYGGFVLCDFIVGGKATALYSGIYNGNESSEARGKKMQTDISASYGKKISGDFGIGKGYSNGQQSSNKFTDLRTSVKTLGGIGAIINFTNPEKVSSIDVNLTQWLASLNNKSTHRIIDISNDGLLPLTEFVLEKNLKVQLAKFYSDYHGITISEFQEPCICIDPKMFIIGTFEGVFLYTRFGNFIKLHDSPENEAEKRALIDQYSSIYKIKVVSGLFNNLFTTLPISIKIDERKTKKYVYNNTTYLLSFENKTGYSIHDDYILDTYGIRKWVATMPTVNINPKQLLDYTIFAL